MANKQIMDIDEFYAKSRNEFGRQQKLWFFSLVLFNLYAPFHMVQVVFTGLKPVSFTCTFQNQTYNNTCGGPSLLKCDTVVYNDGPDSFVKKWSHSPCASTVSQIVQMAYMLGVMTGALTLGHFADHYGRKIVLTLTLIGMIVFGGAGSFCPYFILYVITRFLTGICSAGNMISGFVLSSELVGAKYRSMTGNLFQGFFALGIVAYSALAFLIQNSWQLLGLTSSLIGVCLLLVVFYVPESPRWLFAHGRVKEGNAVLQKIAGNSDMSDVEIITNSRRHTPNGKVTMCQLFRVKPWLVSTQIISWFTNSVVYYALTLSSGHLGANLYLSTSLSGLVELPAYVLTQILIERLGRRGPLAGFMVVAGISCVLLEFTNKNLYIGLLGKCCIAASFSIIYIHSSELFPTVIRNSGVGLCSCFARIGGVVASYFVGTDKNEIWPVISLGVLSVLSGFLNLSLPETLNKKLPETLEDLNKNEVDTSKYSRLLGEDGPSEFVAEDEDDDDIDEFVRS